MYGLSIYPFTQMMSAIYQITQMQTEVFTLVVSDCCTLRLEHVAPRTLLSGLQDTLCESSSSAPVTPWEPTINRHSHLIWRTQCVCTRDTVAHILKIVSVCSSSMFEFPLYCLGYFCTPRLLLFLRECGCVDQIAPCRLFSACMTTKKVTLYLLPVPVLSPFHSG